MDGQTRSGHKIQSLSARCPGSVLSLSNNKSCTKSVQSLSNPGPISVKPLLISKEHGQRLDIKIQSLTSSCPNNLKN